MRDAKSLLEHRRRCVAALAKGDLGKANGLSPNNQEIVEDAFREVNSRLGALSQEDTRSSGGIGEIRY
jgi:hypothetical protein